jgi:hypothetical protein
MNKIQEKLTEYLLSYDALVLIHPDMPEPGDVNGNPNYFENLEIATYSMMAQEKPILYLPMNSHLKNRRIQRVAEYWQKIPFPGKTIQKLSDDEIQSQVDTITSTLGKRNLETKIAAGGTALGVCVTDFMYAWCNSITGPYSSLRVERNISRKINHGRIFPELTDITSLLL